MNIEDIKKIISEKEKELEKIFSDLNSILKDKNSKKFLDSFIGKYLVIKRNNRKIYSGKILEIQPNVIFNQVRKSIVYSLTAKVENDQNSYRIQRIEVLNSDSFELFDSEIAAREISDSIMMPLLENRNKK